MNSPVDVLYEDNHIIVCNKPAGMLVQGDSTGDIPLLEHLKTYIKKKYNKPGNVFLGTVHRLDRPTSGCIVFAKTSKALSRLTQMFAKREIEKIYWALTSKTNIPTNGALVHFIEKNASKNIVLCHNSETKTSKRAELEYKIIRKLRSSLFIEVNLKTGRKHQIRAQLSKIKCPIVGDLKYGFDKPNRDKSICLHCRSLSFIHPVSKKSIEVKAKLPEIPEWSNL